MKSIVKKALESAKEVIVLEKVNDQFFLWEYWGGAYRERGHSTKRRELAPLYKKKIVEHVMRLLGKKVGDAKEIAEKIDTEMSLSKIVDSLELEK